MDGGRVRGLVGVVLAAAGRPPVERDALVAAVEAVAGLRRWLDGVEVGLARALAVVEPAAEVVLASAARSSTRDAGGVLERAATAERVPELGVALSAGEVAGGHVDVVGGVLRQADPGVREALVGEGAWIAGRASVLSPAGLRRELLAEVRLLEADGGRGRLARQRRACRLRSWVDAEGMWCWSGRFDPETGLRLHHRLSATLNTLYRETVPADAPDDPAERQSFLRAKALVALTEGRGTRGAGAEVIVVIDATAPDPTGHPTVDWGLPVELPRAMVEQLSADPTTRITGIVVRHGIVLHAPGALKLGRTTRLANRAQRRVLRGLYPTCALPGCDTRFELCHIHHVTWWEHGGTTDLDNLLPVCHRHHHHIHDQGVQLKLTPDRTLTTTYPNGTTHTTNPPQRR